jgi:hypothetical protein
VLVAIANHECNEGAAELVRGFGPHAPVVAIDSGSRLGPRHEGLFDVRLPNVWYAGLLNEAVAQARRRGERHALYFVCSDVRFADYGAALRRAEQALRDPRVGVYAPCASASSHVQMRRHAGAGLRPVAFVEGFCFAARLALLEEMTPVDTSVNRIGWGLDVYLGFLALRRGLRSVVDDALCVEHPMSSGYALPDARSQRDRWFRRQGASARCFRLLSGSNLAKTRLGWELLSRLPW